MKPSQEGIVRAQKIAAAKKVGPEALHIEQVVQAREYLGPKDFDDEADLDSSAFLPYRYKSPYERTDDFYKMYQIIYVKRYIRRNGKMPGPKSVNIAGLDQRSLASIWRARQIADAMGAPYERFLHVHLDHADAAGTKYLPAPNQLCSKEMYKPVLQAIDELKKAGGIDLLVAGFDPRFFAVNYIGDPQQEAMLDMIQAEIDGLGTASKAKRLARYMTVVGVISEDEAKTRFGPELVALARQDTGGFTAYPPIPLESLQPSEPSCFGCYRQTSDVCMQCPAVERCKELTQEIEGQVVGRYGVSDVPAQRKREGNSKRKSRQRERERTGRTMTDQEQARVLREIGNPKLTKAREEAKERRDGKKKSGSNGEE